MERFSLVLFFSSQTPRSTNGPVPVQLAYQRTEDTKVEARGGGEAKDAPKSRRRQMLKKKNNSGMMSAGEYIKDSKKEGIIFQGNRTGVKHREERDSFHSVLTLQVISKLMCKSHDVDKPTKTDFGVGLALGISVQAVSISPCLVSL